MECTEGETILRSFNRFIVLIVPFSLSRTSKARQQSPVRQPQQQWQHHHQSRLAAQHKSSPSLLLHDHQDCILTPHQDLDVTESFLGGDEMDVMGGDGARYTQQPMVPQPGQQRQGWMQPERRDPRQHQRINHPPPQGQKRQKEQREEPDYANGLINFQVGSRSDEKCDVN